MININGSKIFVERKQVYFFAPPQKKMRNDFNLTMKTLNSIVILWCFFISKNGTEGSLFEEKKKVWIEH